MNDKGLNRPRENLYEYAFAPVPASRRKGTYDIFIVMAGYVVALSCLVIGAQIGYAMPFWAAVGASLAGNAILVFIGMMMASIASRTGWSVSFLSRRALGKRASSILSLAIVLLSINWIGLNGDSFARMILSVVPGWPIPVPVTAVLIVAIWSISAVYGWQGLVRVSKVVVPAGLALTALCMAYIGMSTHGFAPVAEYQPVRQLSFSAAVTAVAGNFLFGCVTTPDICRFAKSSRKASLCVLPAYAVGLFALNVCGIVVAQIGKSADFVAAAARIGLSVPFLLCTVLFLWTTEDNNIYAGSLAVQNLFQGTSVEGNLSHKTVSYLIAGLAAAFAALGAQRYLMPITTFISILIPPVPGILLCEELLLRRSKEHQDVNWVALAAWVLGSAVGALAIWTEFFFAPIAAMASSFLVYLALSKGLNSAADRKK